MDMQTDELLHQILIELRNQKNVLGFGNPPKPRYVYANRQYTDCLWYFWNGAKAEHEPIELNALTGKVVKLEIETKEFRGKPDDKLNLHVEADRKYVIQAGLDTLFGKGLLSWPEQPNFCKFQCGPRSKIHQVWVKQVPKSDSIANACCPKWRSVLLKRDWVNG